MNIIEVNKENCKEIFKKLYDGSAMTVTGIIMDELNQYIDVFKEKCGLHDDFKIYHFTGKIYNDFYKMKDDNRYPADLDFISIELSDMDNYMGVRPMIRWFDDIVENDKSRNRKRCVY